MIRRVILSSALLSAALLAGCGHVSPYEREYLARPSMDAQREAEENRFKSHVFDAREGGIGGYGSTGGGCGCN